VHKIGVSKQTKTSAEKQISCFWWVFTHYCFLGIPNYFSIKG